MYLKILKFKNHSHLSFNCIVTEIKGFDDEDSMVNFLMIENATMNNTALYIGGVAFTNHFHPNGSEFPLKLSYKVRLKSSPRNAGNQGFFNPYKGDTSWNTDFMFPLFQHVGPREHSHECGGSPGMVVCQRIVNYYPK